MFGDHSLRLRGRKGERSRRSPSITGTILTFYPAYTTEATRTIEGKVTL
jgi:hypothetical protein